MTMLRFARFAALMFVLALLLAAKARPVWDQAQWARTLETARAAADDGRPAEAEDLFRSAVERASRFGKRDPRLAQTLSDFAEFYGERGHAAEAKPLYLRAAAIRESNPNTDGGALVACLTDLGNLLRAEGSLEQAEGVYLRALAASERFRGESRETAACLNNLGLTFAALGRYVLAEKYYVESQKVNAKILRPDDPAFATGLNNLGRVRYSQGRLEEAEALFAEAVSRAEASPLIERSRLALFLHNHGVACGELRREETAESDLTRALGIRRETLGDHHPETAASWNSLGKVFYRKGDYAQAEYLHRRAVEVFSETLGADYPETAGALGNLALVLSAEGLYADAGPLFQRSLAILESKLPANHPDLAAPLENYAAFLRKNSLETQAGIMEARARRIQQLRETESARPQSIGTN
ncbi:MAG: hypothetical protein GHCLOJNM_04069 [bacterium]|nr:hypothetical protein [bacterium]